MPLKNLDLPFARCQDKEQHLSFSCGKAPDQESSQRAPSAGGPVTRSNVGNCKPNPRVRTVESLPLGFCSAVRGAWKLPSQSGTKITKLNGLLAVA